jgi:hypothetical protein
VVNNLSHLATHTSRPPRLGASFLNSGPPKKSTVNALGVPYLTQNALRPPSYSSLGLNALSGLSAVFGKR